MSTLKQGNALEAEILLTELREGRLTNVLELLEQKLDASVIALNNRLSKADESEKQDILQVLRGLKQYRQAHPRVREAVILDECEDAQAMAETDRMIRGTADRILDETK